MSCARNKLTKPRQQRRIADFGSYAKKLVVCLVIGYGPEVTMK
jgi:hypothetical protein